MTRRIASRWLAAAAAACLGGATAGCMRAPDWGATVAGGHAEADRLLDGGDRAGARRALMAIVDGAPAAAAGPNRRELLQDTYFRLAGLALEDGQPLVRLAGGGEDLFTANLLVVRGRAREALGQAGGALDDYHRALEINDRLLHQLLDGHHP